MDHTRHSGIFSARDWSITLIGCGGIGALAAVVLAKMGIEYLTVFDDDVVDDVNIATQFYQYEQVGLSKVVALADALRRYSDEIEFVLHQERVGPGYNPEAIANHIIISAVDSIDARKEIWDVVKRSHWIWYLDARMGAENFMRYAVRHGDAEWYDDALAKQNEADVPELPCTSKATIYGACLSAAWIGHDVRSIIVGDVPPRVLSCDMNSQTLLVVSL